MATAPGAAFGGAGNQRLEAHYYAKGACTSPSAGRPQTIRYPDGTQDSFTFEYGNYTVNADPAQNSFAVNAAGSALRK